MKNLIKFLICLVFISIYSINIHSQTISHIKTYDNLLNGDTLYEYGAPKLKEGKLDDLQFTYYVNYESSKDYAAGTVQIKVLINTSGKPTDPVIVKGLTDYCNKIAIDTVMKLRFIPSIENNKKQKSYSIIPVKFIGIFDKQHNYPLDSNCIKIYNKADIGCVFLEKAPKLLSNPDSIKAWTIFPEEAKKHLIYGRVFIKLRVDTLGVPECEMILWGIPYGCNEAALNVVKRMRFSPAIQAHRKFVATIVIPIEFRLKL